MKRSEAISSRSISTGSSSSMLITVGMPIEKVIRLSLIQSKNRPCEKRRAKCSVQPVCIHGSRLAPWAEFQPKDRYSSVRSSPVRPIRSMVDSPNSQCPIMSQTKSLGVSVVPEVQ